MQNRPREKGFRRRLIAVLIVVAVILAIFAVRLVQFQLLEEGPYLGISSSVTLQADSSGRVGREGGVRKLLSRGIKVVKNG